MTGDRHLRPVDNDDQDEPVVELADPAPTRRHRVVQMNPVKERIDALRRLVHPPTDDGDDAA